jgi:hypothetical protein
LEKINEGNKITTTCNHTFCKTCLDIALKNKRNCPSCRNMTPIPEKKIEINFVLANEIETPEIYIENNKLCCKLNSKALERVFKL